MELNQLDIVRVYIAAGANVNWTAARVHTPLQVATSCGHIDMVIALVEAGAEKDSSNSTSDSPLACACKIGLREVARLLHKRGADVNRFPVRILHCVVFRDDVELLQALLDAGVNFLWSYQ